MNINVLPFPNPKGSHIDLHRTFPRIPKPITYWQAVRGFPMHSIGHYSIALRNASHCFAGIGVSLKSTGGSFASGSPSRK